MSFDRVPRSWVPRALHVLFSAVRLTMRAEASAVQHRKRVRHFHEPGHMHELTFSCYQRMPLLTNDDWREKLSRTIDMANVAAQISLAAFVFMPEHVHLLVWSETPKPPISLYLARVKQPFSKQIKEILVRKQSPLAARLMVREGPNKTCFRFWQAGPGFDRNIWTIKAIQASSDYIHSNPVKRGLCQRAVDWPWSSARYYHGDPPAEQDPRLPFIHGLPAGALT